MFVRPRKRYKPTHPLAAPNMSGALGMHAGDRVRHILDGRCGVADEFLQDGDCFITWNDGKFGIVKWNNLEPVK